MMTEKSPSSSPKRFRKKALGILCVLGLAGSMAVPTAWGVEPEDGRLQALERKNRELKNQISLLQKQVQTLAPKNQAGSNPSEGTKGETDSKNIAGSNPSEETKGETDSTPIEIDELETQVQALQALLSDVERDGENLVLKGKNLEVNKGTGATDRATK